MTAVAPAAPAPAPAAGPGSPGGPAPARRRWWRGAAVAVVAGLAFTGIAYGALALRADDPEPAALGPGDVTVRLDIEHSLFSPESLRVVEGTRVRFVVVNGDPIHHELIVGPPSVHARHENGSEASHPSIPGEVTLELGGTAVTTFTFDRPGTVEYACHLPGHYQHGMHGVVEVVPAA
jgi:uncharacterized cupredoxin-like copper-binding protein